MGKKGGGRHLKRRAAPGFWPLHVKEAQWTTKPLPGPHPLDRSISLLVLLRDTLGFVRTASEGKLVLAEGKIKVDGRIRRDPRFPVGLMDVVELPDANVAYRILPAEKPGLTALRISRDEAKSKVCRIDGKNSLKKGAIQLNLHDGRNIVVQSKDTKSGLEIPYRPRDSLRIALPTQKILNHLKFAEKSFALITSGRNLGKHGRIKSITRGGFSDPGFVTVEDENGNSYRTIPDHVLVVGEDKLAVKLS